VSSGAVGKDCQRRLLSRPRFVRACSATDLFLKEILRLKNEETLKLIVLLQAHAVKADPEKRLHNFFEPLLQRLEPSASKILKEEVLISLVIVCYCRRYMKINYCYD
jgi:hypothetical protein